MRAAVLERLGEPLVVRDVEEPVPMHGEVVVRTRAAGLCRTDLKVVDGAIPTVRPPLIPGHELAGEVVALGPGVDAVAPGDAVLVILDISCGTCPYCVIGERDHCANLRRLGMEQDGALAEYVRVPAANLVAIPDGMTYATAATIADAVGSPYHAITRQAQVRPGQTVAIYGLGGLGLAAVQIAHLSGANVIAITRTPERRRLALDLGADAVIDPNDGSVAEQVRERTDGLGVHAFIDIVGIEGSVQQGVTACRKGGRVVVLGYAVPEVVASMVQLVYGEIAIVGSRGSTSADLRDAVGLVANGRITPIIGREVTLDDVNDALDGIRDGSVIGRTVVTFA